MLPQAQYGALVCRSTPRRRIALRALLRRLPMASVANPRKLVDLGAGDGRIVIAAAARRNFQAVGYEFNPWLVLCARLASLAAGVGSSDHCVCTTPPGALGEQILSVVTCFLRRRCRA